MKTLVSLVSEQTLPNLELIKEFNGQVDEYIFFHSDKTEKQTNWIIKAARLREEQCKRHVIKAFDSNQITELLNSIEFGDKDYILNITGGTKLWIMIFLERFKELGAEIYYLTGHQKGFIKVFPLKGQRMLKLQRHINLTEYLESYGFEIEHKPIVLKNEVTDRMFDFFKENPIEDFRDSLGYFRQLRNQKKFRDITINDMPEHAQKFLDEIQYPVNHNTINKEDVVILSGEWLELWVYDKIKSEFNLDDCDIATGCVLKKENVQNEMDVIFVLNHQLYTIECKTAVHEEREMPDGTSRRVNILGETIYKSDSLRSKFGLFARSYILTMSELLDENLQPKQDFKMHFDRAELSNISIVSRRKLLQSDRLSEILKIRYAD